VPVRYLYRKSLITCNGMSQKRKEEDEQAKERGFIIRFSIYALFFFVAAVLMPDSVYAPLNRLTAGLTGMLLDVFGLSAMIRGEYIYAGKLSLLIVPECTPVFMILILAAFIFSFPAKPAKRIQGLLAGAAFLTAANLMRLGVTIALGSAKPSWFNYLHAYVGQIWSMMILLAGCYIWMHLWIRALTTRTRSSAPKS